MDRTSARHRRPGLEINTGSPWYGPRCPRLWQWLQWNISPGSPCVHHDRMFSVAVNVPRTESIIQFMFSQKWNCTASFPNHTFMYLWAIYIFPGSVCLFGCSKIGRQILAVYKSHRSQVHELGNWETEHYESDLEITRPCSFISRNT